MAMKNSVVALAVCIALLASSIGLSAQNPPINVSKDQKVVQLSSDCTVKNLPQGFSRIFIASNPAGSAKANHSDGSGKLNDPYDGSTAEKFDAILRSRSESNQQNLIVCIGPGTFQTEGTYDFVVNLPHKTARGFTLNKNWKVHGAGADRTILKLINFFPNPPGGARGTGVGAVFSTHDDAASGIEISDLSIDDNYSELKTKAQQQGIGALNLNAIQLRSDQGGHWIHRLSVSHSAGEINETFPVWIYSVNTKSPYINIGNIIEYVTISGWGGGKCTAIAVAAAIAEVRNNSVADYQIGYGGWSMGKMSFHDNVATNTAYGFNIDSLDNEGVVIKNNQIIHPKEYGIVVGGGGHYANFEITDNTFQINSKSVIPILLQGNVINARIERNTFFADPPANKNIRTIVTKGHGNQANTDNGNKVVTR
ncbi:MAG TPA: hypothetical protein VG649_19580 [Candidatus Angelobacter sp.]|jgi:hypothetical protein|nr:hypothetical protein [Candidatus Angelobacter sp.]